MSGVRVLGCTCDIDTPVYRYGPVSVHWRIDKGEARAEPPPHHDVARRAAHAKGSGE
ncbi:hypothetical protein GCM10023082_10950 [Streptomyces tremellae]|uniref:Uncharacterized protein n=1 Tax=Streptomyces tremellae TaxID=1124239 RepID=A0ABP7E6K2_9ACTN